MNERQDPNQFSSRPSRPSRNDIIDCDFEEIVDQPVHDVKSGVNGDATGVADLLKDDNLAEVVLHDIVGRRADHGPGDGPADAPGHGPGHGPGRDPSDTASYVHRSAGPSPCHAHLMPALFSELASLRLADRAATPIFDLGCGAGYVASELTRVGYRVMGIDPSPSAQQLWQQAYPDLDLHAGSASEDLPQRFGRFQVVVSLQVVEYLQDPRAYTRTLFNLLRPGGTAIVSTPYHGYWKNLAIAAAGATDRHVDPLRHGGQVKFWSVNTLGSLLRETGFVVRYIRRIGGMAPLARSMMAVVVRPPVVTTWR